MNILNIIWDIDPVLFKAGPIQFRYYSLCWILAFASGFCVLKGIYEKENIPHEKLLSLLIYIFFGTLIGARLGHCLFYDPVYFLTHPLEMLLPFGKDEYGDFIFTGYAGLASHGGAIGIVIAIGIYSYRYKVRVWGILDQLALVAPLAGMFIRLGNFFNSEIVGYPTNMPWGVVFSRVDNLSRHPAQLYEAIAYLAIFIVLYYLYTRKQENFQAGFLFGLALILIFSFRFFVEFYKEAQEDFESGMLFDMGQYLSIPFFIGGIVIIILKHKTHKGIS
ncbi:MAG: prolipoprotein diacylglyceryl transferase [Prevotella sp.]|jgi:prolipoprotein diacylglyceryl transferase|nr:prolipoprotein diacylglyceryl transferase [Prevotella sp.]